MIPGFSLRQLGYFVAVAEHGSMAAAAEAEYVSQAAISVGIQDLERRLSVPLLSRRPGRGAILTEAGTAVLEDARRVLDASKELVSRAKNPEAELRGTLNLGCFTTLCPVHLPPLLGTFAFEHPALSLVVLEGSQETLRNALSTGACEMAITYDLNLGQGLKKARIQHMRPLVLLPAAHPLAAQDFLSVADLAGMPLIEYANEPSSSGQFARESGIDAEVVHRSSNIEVVRSLVARGLGCAFVLQRWPVSLSLEGLPLAAVPLSEEVPGVDIVAAWPEQDKLSRRARAVVTFLQSFAQPSSSNPTSVFINEEPETQS